MWERLLELLRKEFLQLFRDRTAKGIVFGLPVIQLMLFGYVVSTDVKNIDMAVADLDRSRESRDLLDRFRASRYFTVKYWAQSSRELEDLLLDQKISLTLYIPHGFAEHLAHHNGSAPIQTSVDGTVSNIASVAAAYTTEVISRYTMEQMRKRLQQTAGQMPLELRRMLPHPDQGVDMRIRAWYNPDLESRIFFVPGVLAFLLMILSISLTSMGMVREKELGTMEQLMVTPIRPLELILGKTIPFAITGMVDLLLISVIVVFWFQVPVRGHILLVYGGGLIFIACALGIGLLISTVSKTMQQAVLTSFFFLNPLFLLSGFAFPVEDMPWLIQMITYLNPLRHYLLIVRSVLLRGADFFQLWPHFLWITGSAIFLLGIASMRVHKHLE